MTENTITTKIKSRSIQDDNDFRLVRDLLIETYPITPPDWNWEIRRWDGSFYHHEEPGWEAQWGEGGKLVRLWETEDGRLVGAIFPEEKGDAHIQLHPDYRYIEEEMIAWAEENLGVPVEDGSRRNLRIFVYEYDAPRRRLLEERGYEKLTSGCVIRRLRFGNISLPKPEIAEGYILRTRRRDDEAEHQRLADLLNAAFRRSCHTAKEVRMFVQNSPSYRNDLDLVAEAPDGSFAAHVGMMYDEANRFGLFEPVCTHPDHRQKKLASTLMFEGMHRVRAMGATDVYVGAGDQVAANRLYESVGFTEIYKGYNWHKLL